MQKKYLTEKSTHDKNFQQTQPDKGHFIYIFKIYKRYYIYIYITVIMAMMSQRKLLCREP